MTDPAIHIGDVIAYRSKSAGLSWRVEHIAKDGTWMVQSLQTGKWGLISPDNQDVFYVQHSRGAYARD